MNQKPVQGRRSKLRPFEDETSIFVEGSTFRYGFDKKSGLINRLEVLGDDFLRDMDSEIPDIYISNVRDPREAFYAARYEDKAECDVISANPYEIHIRTHGMYHNDRGEKFPVRYRITYEIQSDGTIFIIVDNKVYDPCVIRWLCISRGLLNSSLCKYFSHLADQSIIDTTEDYTFQELPSDSMQDQTLFSGRLIPWFWLGNNRTGVEISVWDVTHHRYGATQVAGRMVDPLGKIGGNISCRRQVSGSSDGVLWEIFSLRNVQTPAKEGWEQIDYFALSVSPPKHYNPEFSDMQVYWVGPRRYNTEYKYLSDDEIGEFSRMGYDLIIGGVNWRAGECVPDDESEARRVISSCHRHDMKIIPCVPMMDLNHDTAVFEEYGPEWRIEPVVEYESETALMCPGAAGWREYWMKQIDRVVEDFDFDGVYLDFWYDKLTCRNPRHGCQRRYMRPTFTWLRDMLRHAMAKFKAKNPDSIIVGNTDLLPISMVCSWLDIRSVGGSQDVRDVDRVTGKAFYSSYRLGCNSLMWTDQGQEIDHRVISLSLLYMSPIILNREHSREERELIQRYWGVLKAFGVNEARWYPGFVDDSEVVATDNPDLCVNVHRRDGLLLALVNLSPDEIHAAVSIINFAELGLEDGKKYLVYEPLCKMFLGGKKDWACDDLKAINVTVPGHNPRLLHICECSREPALLFEQMGLINKT